MDQDAYNWISRRAHQIWEQEGCPSGKDREHWYRAVAEWETKGNRSYEPPLGTRIVTVLVVEDEALIRFATADALEAAGFKVLEASCADEALVLLHGHQVDMPGQIDGLGLMDRVRTQSPEVRVVVTSAHIALGPFDLASGVFFLPKPYTPEALIKMLKAL